MEIEKIKLGSSFKCPVKFSKLINLDMGRCYIGFVQDSYNGNCAIDLINWKMHGFNIFISDDAWNGLTLDFVVKWPLNLIISTQILEKYRTIFRYFYPIRQI